MDKKERREAVKTFDLVKLAEMFDYTPIPLGRHYIQQVKVEIQSVF